MEDPSEVSSSGNDAADSSSALAQQEQEQQPPQQLGRDDLIELIRAIKFAKPDASQSQVHKEITQELSQKSPEFEFLKDVHIHDVKKVWKKAMTAAANAPAAAGNSDNAAAATNNQDLKDQLLANKGPIQLFTVGNGSIQHLAQDYTAAYIAAQEQLAQQEEQSRMQDYVYVFLNVPADKSGSRPHQALIHFPKNNKDSNASSAAVGGNKPASAGGNKKKQNKKKKNAKAAAPALPLNDNIVKIQMAASDENTKYPMLVYNQSRTAKTFLHPSDEGYDRIQEWIVKQGVGGTLGSSGGTKAYFHCNVLSYKGGEDILQIQVTELAPEQDW